MVSDLVDTVRSHLLVSPAEFCASDQALQDLVRWIMTVVMADTDTRTIDEWARRAGASTPTIFARCARENIKAKALLDLGRLLRIARMPQPRPQYVVDALNARDIRTVGALLDRAGLSIQELHRSDPWKVMATQRLISHKHFTELLIRAMRL